MTQEEIQQEKQLAVEEFQHAIDAAMDPESELGGGDFGHSALDRLKKIRLESVNE